MSSRDSSSIGSTRHTVRVLVAGWRSEIAAASEYRGDMVSGTVISVAWLAVAAAPALVVTLHADSAGGWTLGRLLFLLSIWYFMDALLWVFLFPNVSQWSQAVQLGTLDAVLLRPLNSLVMCSLRNINVQDLPKVLLAIGLAGVALFQGGGPADIAAVIGMIVAVAAGACLMWAFAVLLNYKSLTHVHFDGMFALHAAHNLARVPVPLYGTVISVVLTAVIPVAFLTTVPAEIFYGVTHPLFALVSVVVAVVAIVVTSWLWKREIRRYAGAMG